MSKTALAFPGIGVKPSGRECRFFEEHRARVEPFFTEASIVAGEDLSSCLFERSSTRADSDGLPEHLFALAFGAGFAKVLQCAGVCVDYGAGFSFGIYPALFASGAVNFTNCVRIVVRAHALSSQACRDANTAMAAIVGLSIPELDGIIKLVDGDVQIVNVTTDTSAIIAGNADSVDVCVSQAKRQDALGAGRLTVGAAYHHSGYLGAASREFAEFLRDIPFSSPRFPVVSSVDFRFLYTGAALRNFTADNLGDPIHWLNVVKALSDRGTTRIIEAGAGVSLTRNGRFMPLDIAYVNIKNYRRKLSI